MQSRLSLPNGRAAAALLAAFLLVGMVLLLATSLWPRALRAYAIARIESAKREGVYADPVVGMRELIEQSYREVERVEIVQAGTNSFDGSRPHVWFVTARVYGGVRGDGRTIPEGDYDYPGSFFLHIEDGWIHVPEGALPRLVGRAMERFELYGCNATTGNCS